MEYQSKPTRYNNMKYRRCGNSGLMLPTLTLGLWHNFGNINTFEIQRQLVRTAFDNGITHFDLANNYGPPPGAAEYNFGKIMELDMKLYRDEIIVSTKAGYDMWPGPYGNWGSKKHLIASIDQSLLRLNLEYVDIFYHHRPDDDTPLEETMSTLSDIVRRGKALYIGLSNYTAKQAAEAVAILNNYSTPCLICQPSYSMLNRWAEKDGLFDYLGESGIGTIAYSCLAQGLLTGKYLDQIPADSRIARDPRFLKSSDIKEETMNTIRKLDTIAKNRKQTLSQLAIAWVLRKEQITSALIGASRPEQLLENVQALNNLDFSKDELFEIDNLLA